jgi:transcriptional regulator with XRE-family HTH domain
METLGQRVRRVREERGMSQREVADAVGVSQSTYSDLERGETAGKSLAMLGRIASYLSVDADFLLGTEEVEKKRATLAGLTPLERELLTVLRGLRASRRRTLLSVARSLQEEERQERRYDELVAAIEQIDQVGLLARVQERLTQLMRETGSMEQAVNRLAAELAAAGMPLASAQSPEDTLQE